MIKAKMMVFAAAKDGRREDLDQWYDSRHVPDLLAVPGITSIERFDVRLMKVPEGCPRWDFLGVYQIEAESIDSVMAEMKVRMGTPQMPASDAIDSTKTLSLIASDKAKAAQ